MLIRHKRERAHVIEPLSGPSIEVGPGEVIEVDELLGASLCDQVDAFEAVDDKPAAKAAKKES